jgi:hypothetical protein
MHPFAGVLNPGERLIWTGQPKRRIQAVLRPRYLVMLAAVIGCALVTWMSHLAGPLPIWAQIELIAAGGVFVAPLWFLGREARATAYAVTSRRLLMAIGPQIREVSLGELGPMRIHYVREYGTVLDFSRRGDGSRAGSGATPAVWTFLDTGKRDRVYRPWSVDDPEAVRQLIDAASNNYWFGAGEGSAKAT